MSHELEADGADYYEHERLCRLHDEETNVERELRGEIERLERENSALRDLAAHRGAFIDHHRITTPAHSIVFFNNEDQLAWEKLVERIKERDRVLIDAARSKEGGAS